MRKIFSNIAVLLAVLITVLIPHYSRAATADYWDTVQKIYIGYYQRPADPVGLTYWAERLDQAGGNLNEIIAAFSGCPESQALYGTINSSNIGDVVDSIYMAMFNRTAEVAGKEWWVHGFNAGTYTAGDIMLQILNGAQNNDLQTINNKLTAANLFTKTIDPELDGYFFQATYDGNADAIAGRNFLAAVTADSTSIPTQAQTTAFLSNNIANPGDPLSAGGLAGTWEGAMFPGYNISFQVVKIDDAFYIMAGSGSYYSGGCSGVLYMSWSFTDKAYRIDGNQCNIVFDDEIYVGDNQGTELHLNFESGTKLSGTWVGEIICPPGLINGTLLAYHCIDNDGDGYDSCHDCDDDRADIHPGANEICDGVDNNCDSQIDEGLFYPDLDHDGYGDRNATGLSCPAPEGYISNNGDSDDSNYFINPGITEICRNGIDDNGNGVEDENCTATTLHVPGNYETIQNAINVAINDDVIQVADGTYVENLDFRGKSITVKSDNGPLFTFIDGGLNGPVVSFQAAFSSSNTPRAMLEGFTLTNGLAEYGGGIYSNNIHSTINNCRIIQNSSTIDGGGIYKESESCGGITVSNSIISGNSAGGSGGGVCSAANEGLITGFNIINSNITGNIALEGNGGGLYFGKNANGNLINCTISGNHAQISGGGFKADTWASVYVKNSILWGNATDGLSSGYEYTGGISGGITFSDIKGKSLIFGYDQYGNPLYLDPDEPDHYDNISSDPLFVDPRDAAQAPTAEGDYHLSSGSPCIDKGTETGAPAVDIDGDIRPQGAGYDMGADEYWEE